MLQQRGLAAMPILTRPFSTVLSRLMAYYAPDQPLPFGVLDHPMQNITDAELDLRVEQLVAVIESHLPSP